MQNRIFIAINLPEEVKKKLMNHYDDWPNLPIKWTKKDNIHITLVFIGNCSNDEILEICEKTKEVAKGHQSFSITLNKIAYGPPNKLPPRMVWTIGEKSQELGKLQNELENAVLSSSGKAGAYSPHITLGRIRTWQWKEIEPEERSDVNAEIDLTFEVNSVEVMNSELKKGGPDYTILESCLLKN